MSAKIDKIIPALNAYSDIEAPDIVRATLEGFDAHAIGVLTGIAGCFCHAVSAKMPAKWLRQLHGDLLDAFSHYSREAHDRRSAGGAQ